MTKVCTKCGIEKNVPDAFYKKGFYVDGKQKYASECKKCKHLMCAQYNKTEQGKQAAIRKAVKYQKSEHGKEVIKRYHQSEEWKEVSRKAKAKYRKSEHGISKEKEYWQSEKGKEVQRKVKAKYRKSEHGIKKIKEYWGSEAGKAAIARYDHKRRALIKKACNDLTATQWNVILRRQEYCCNHCGSPFCSGLKATRDHIIPVTKGGGLTKDNVQALCQSCNSSKGTKDNSFIVNNMGNK